MLYGLLLLVALFAYFKWTAVLYYIRYTVLTVNLILACSSAIICVPFICLLHGKEKLYYVNYVTSVVFTFLSRWILGIRTEIEGREIIDKINDPIILMNHQCAVDLVPVCSIAKKNSIILCKSSLRWIPIFGWMLYFGQNVFIDRFVGSTEDKMNMIYKAYEDKSDICSFIIFPEGTRSRQKNHTMLPFKKGAFHLGVRYRKKVIPTVVSTYYPELSKAEKRFNTRLVRVKVLPAIDCSNYTQDDVGKLAESTREQMIEVLKTMHS